MNLWFLVSQGKVWMTRLLEVAGQFVYLHPWKLIMLSVIYVIMSFQPIRVYLTSLFSFGTKCLSFMNVILSYFILSVGWCNCILGQNFGILQFHYVSCSQYLVSLLVENYISIFIWFGILHHSSEGTIIYIYIVFWRMSWCFGCL